MATHIIQIEKHKFVCGLFWQSLSRPRDLRREAAELARRIDSDLMVIRKDHAMAQAGFTHSRHGMRRGMLSLAAVVSKTLAVEGAYYDGQQQPAHNWLSAFKLPDGRWAYFAVRDANFLPNGDFAGTKEEVLDRLHGDYGLGGWNVVVGDAELEEHGFHNFCAKSIQDLIPQKHGRIVAHKWWALAPVERSVPWKLILAGGAAVAVAGVGAIAYWQSYQRQKEEEARARAIEVARQKMLGQPVPAVASHPWPKKPMPLATARACIDRFDLIAPGGWVLDEYVCAPGQASYAWSRGQSTVDYLLEKVPDAKVEMNGDKASYADGWDSSAGLDEDLMEAKKLLRRLHSRFQLLGVTLKFPAPQDTPQPALPGIERKAPKTEWQAIPFSLNANGLPPTDMAVALSEPGVRLEKISYKAGTWSIEGVIYAK